MKRVTLKMIRYIVGLGYASAMICGSGDGMVMIGTRSWETGEELAENLPSKVAQNKACDASIAAGESNPDIINACPLR